MASVTVSSLVDTVRPTVILKN